MKLLDKWKPSDECFKYRNRNRNRGSFITKLKVEFDLTLQIWKLQKKLAYQVMREDSIIVAPAGFLTDFASIPKWVPRYLVDVLDIKVMQAAVIHDYLYSTEQVGYSRKKADAILKEILLILHVPAWRAQIVYFAVRIGGGSHWKE